MYSLLFGLFAEMALANTESIAYKPNKLTHVEAAALPLVGVSAWRALTENIGLSKGQRILIHGGAGGIQKLMDQYDIKAIFQFTQADRERLTKLAQWVDQNNIRVNVEKTFSLDEAGKALDYQKDVHPRGKVVLTV
jgi:NADPH:quinone reductase-like Zn-dependent oxidoreductase